MRTQDAGTLVSASDLVTVSDYFSFAGADSQGRVALKPRHALLALPNFR
jgi:hypothetical protein